ncbi:NmrA family transcriptional regulator [Ochrobactrum sp. CM-21-5]|nr:NmrA family transcriptional regulator [Ochrobactrum sp. CM-21-5]
MENGPLAEHIDLNTMREINPEILSFRSWLATSGRKALDEALGASAT